MNDKKLDELNKGIKVLIFFVIILIVLVSCFFAVFMLSNDKETTKTNNKETTTTKTIASYKDYKVLELGEVFYETFYWPSCGEGGNDKRKEILKQINDVGITISLDNIIRYAVTTAEYSDLYSGMSVTDKSDSMVKESFSNYNTQETKVIIYPKEPYGVKDYTIELNIVNK